MPRIAFTIPITPGKQDECVRLLKKYKAELDKAHQAVGATQWVKFIYRDEYFELVDWKGRPLAAMLKEYLARPELQKFISEIGPCLLMPSAPPGKEAADVIAEFLQGRAFNQAYAFVPPPA